MRQLCKDLLLGEGCVWDNRSNTLYWVDILDNSVYQIIEGEETSRKFQFSDYVGCVVPMEDGHLLVAVKDTLVILNPKDGVRKEMLKVIFDKTIRFNDGKADKYGNLWIGTMAIEQSDSNAVDKGSLICIKNGVVVAKYDGYTISNGIAWNEEGTILYHVDSYDKKVYAYDVVNQTELLNKRIIIDTDQEGIPDGMTIDNNDNLWIAIWGGRKVVCYSLQTREKVNEINIDDVRISENASCCTFGGKYLDKLFITTAKNSDGILGGLYSVDITQGIGTKAYFYSNVDIYNS